MARRIMWGGEDGRRGANRDQILPVAEVEAVAQLVVKLLLCRQKVYPAPSGAAKDPQIETLGDSC